MNFPKKIVSFYLSLLISATMLKAVEEKINIVTISQKELYSDSQKLKNKLAKAAQQGFFYVEMPKKIKNLIPAAVDFANTFYHDETLKKLNLPGFGFSGYHDLEHTQVEYFTAEREFWNITYPKAIQKLAKYTNDLSLHILRTVVPLVIPQLSPNQLNHATGDLLNGGGLYHLSFNHYQPAKKEIGLNSHRDFGYVTLLFINKKGLYAKINDKWKRIEPKPGYFVINFGRVFEILVNDPNKLNAAWHFVETIKEETHNGDRISFGLFSDNDLNIPVQRVSPDGTIEVVYPSYKQFIDDSFKDVCAKVDLPELD